MTWLQCLADVYGHACMPFHPSCPCCELPVCGPSDMTLTVLVRVGPQSVTIFRLAIHDEEFGVDDDDEYNDDDDEYDDMDLAYRRFSQLIQGSGARPKGSDAADRSRGIDDSSSGQQANISVLRNNPFFELGDYDDDDDADLSIDPSIPSAAHRQYHDSRSK
jgi:hypothetical protein